MTLPASGIITLSDVNIELGYAANAPISLNDAAVRTLFGKPSGAISMSDGYGKSRTLDMYNLDSSPQYYWDEYSSIESGFQGTYVKWNGVTVIQNGPQSSPQSASGYTYTRLVYQETKGAAGGWDDYYMVRRTQN